VLPGTPVGVALAAGALVSAAAGGVVVLRWSRDAVAVGADPGDARSGAVRALITAHAIAAVPVGLAVLLAG
jgi:hypothetical protein